MQKYILKVSTNLPEGTPEGLPEGPLCWSSLRTGEGPPLFILNCFKVRTGLSALDTGEAETKAEAKSKLIQSMTRIRLYMTATMKVLGSGSLRKVGYKRYFCPGLWRLFIIVRRV